MYPMPIWYIYGLMEAMHSHVWRQIVGPCTFSNTKAHLNKRERGIRRAKRKILISIRFCDCIVFILHYGLWSRSSQYKASIFQIRPIVSSSSFLSYFFFLKKRYFSKITFAHLLSEVWNNNI